MKPCFYRIFFGLSLITISWLLVWNYSFNQSFHESELTSTQTMNLPQVFQLNRLNYTFYTSHDWVFNFNISQYSTLVSQHKNNSILFETTVFVDHIELGPNASDFLNQNLMCFILIGNRKLARIRPLKTLIILSRFLRISCQIEHDRKISLTDTTLLGFAVLDMKYFKFYQYLNENKIVSVNRVATLILCYIKYNFLNVIQVLHLQKPIYVDRSILRRKAVAHCVHMLRHLNEKRFAHLIDWIRIQKSIGIAQIKIYLIEWNEELDRTVQAKFKDLVQVIDYKIDLTSICKLEINNKNFYKNSQLYQQLYANCEAAFNKHFNMAIDIVSNKHEQFQSNDCLLKFKYDYEFVSNYDIDEVIFPRRFDWPRLMEQHLNNESCEQNINKFITKFEASSYNIYDFVTDLSNTYSFKVI